MRTLKQTASLCLVTMLLFSAVLAPAPVDAKKKKKDAAAAAELERKKQEEVLKKEIEPVNKTLVTLLVKSQSRVLYTPDDAGKMADAKYKLMDFMMANPKSPVLIRPVYQAGVLLKKREQYEDAFELLNYLAANYPEDPYGQRARMEIEGMKKFLGSKFVENVTALSAPPPAAIAETPDEKTGAKTDQKPEPKKDPAKKK